VVVSGVLHWGFSVRIPGASAGGPTYPVIPPSTVLGALSRPWCMERGYAVRENTSCTKEFIDSVAKRVIEWGRGDEPGVLVSIRNPYTVTMDLMRQERIPYRQSKYKGDRNQWFGVSAFGKAYAPGAEFRIYLLIRDGVGDELGQLLRSAWRMASLGSKESAISVKSVEVREAVRVHRGRVYAYAPANCVKSRTGFTEVALPVEAPYGLMNTARSLPIGRMASYVVPVMLNIYGVPRDIDASELAEGCGMYLVDDEALIWYA